MIVAAYADNANFPDYEGSEFFAGTGAENDGVMPVLQRAIATRMMQTAEVSAAQQKARELRSRKPQPKGKGKGDKVEGGG